MKFRFIFILLIIFSFGFLLGYQNTGKNLSIKKAAEKNTPKAFLSESYDKIKDNYWDNISEPALIEMFKNASSALGKPINANVGNKEELIQNLDKELAPKLVSQVLANLKPTGRSGLFTTKQEEALKNTVSNINPEKDLYKDLGVSKGASEDEVKTAFQKQEEELKKQASPEAKTKLKEIAYAKDVLTKEDTKKRYDSGGIEPTIFTKVFPKTLYLQFKKFSPTSLDEFQKAFDENKDSEAVDSLILDLRGNIGGAIDGTAYLLGFFLGKNQYAFDFYHKGEYLPFRTQTDKIPSISKYIQIVVLIDNQTQSSAEMLVSSFKKYHLGIVLGSPTRGWGTVEKVFPLDNQIKSDEKYSIFLVHSVTLRDDNQPIEGRGVDPDVNINDKDWQQKLSILLRNQDLITAIKNVL